MIINDPRYRYHILKLIRIIIRNLTLKLIDISCLDSIAFIGFVFYY